jgi:hypothetical protein
MTPPLGDAELRGPDRLAPPRVAVVRLNRRVLYLIGAALVVVVIAGLVALRAQGGRQAQRGEPGSGLTPSTRRRGALVRQGPGSGAEPATGELQHAARHAAGRAFGLGCGGPPATRGKPAHPGSAAAGQDAE